MPENRPVPHSALAARASLIVLLAALTLSACGDAVPVEPPVPPGELAEGIWRLDKANGLDLPGAEIARRIIGVIDEQTLLDSARIVVDVEGSWEQRYYVRIFHNGALDRSEVVVDEGTWAENGSTNEFVSTVRTRSFEITVLGPTRAASEEPMVFFANAPLVDGVYLLVPPAP